MALSPCWTPVTSPPGKFGSSASSPPADRPDPAAHGGRAWRLKYDAGTPLVGVCRRRTLVNGICLSPTCLCRLGKAVQPKPLVKRPLVLRGKLDDLSREHEVRIRDGVQVGVGKVLPPTLDAQLLRNDAQGVPGLQGVRLAAERNRGCVPRRGGLPDRSVLDRRALSLGALHRYALYGGALDRCSAAAAQSQLRRAGRPGTPALGSLNPRGYSDLLFTAGVFGGARSAIRGPGAGGE